VSTILLALDEGPRAGKRGILENPVRNDEPVDSAMTLFETVRWNHNSSIVLESLILAQDERWQCALDMQVERSTVNRKGIGD
jgi:hypothetical protein